MGCRIVMVYTRTYTREDLKRALAVSKQVHSGQLYGDKDYFTEHIRGVVKNLHDIASPEIVLIIGALHDVYEDTDITREQIIHDFGEDIDDYIWVLTRQKDEQYFDYIRRVKNNWIARTVKIADVEFNLKASALSGDKSRQDRYEKALLILMGYD